MKRSNRLVILVGVLLAVLAFVAIVILLNSREEAVAPEEIRETVLVASEDIGIGDSVTPDLVEEQLIDPEAVVPTPLRSTTAVSGQPALFPIPAGSQVTAETIGLGTGADVDIAARLNPGEKAVAFQVDAVTGLNLLVKEGDSIDVILSQSVPAVQETADSAANPDENAPPRFEPVTGLANPGSVKAVLQDKRVLYVSETRAQAPEPVDSDGDGTPDEQQPPPEAEPLTAIIIFAGTDQDAEVIKFAQGPEGSLTAVIRHADDNAVEETLGITIDQLVDEFGLRIPSIVEQLNEDSAP